MSSEDKQRELRSCTKSHAVRSVLFNDRINRPSLNPVAHQIAAKTTSLNQAVVHLTACGLRESLFLWSGVATMGINSACCDVP